MGASHYRRALDLMLPSACHWAHVTLYYGAFFAARALLGMFGCGVLHNYVVHVNRSRPGDQELHVERMVSGGDGYYVTQKGSHRRFWEIFYKTVRSLSRWVDARFAPALEPISSRNTWLIEQRNNVNYKTTASLSMAASFSRTFAEDRFPDSLPGALQTQYQVSKSILVVSSSFAKRFGLATDALLPFGSSSSFEQVVGDQIYGVSLPDIVEKTNRDEIFRVQGAHT